MYLDFCFFFRTGGCSLLCIGFFFLVDDLQNLLPICPDGFFIIRKTRLVHGVCPVKSHGGKRCQSDPAGDDTAHHRAFFYNGPEGGSVLLFERFTQKESRFTLTTGTWMAVLTASGKDTARIETADFA